MFRLLRAILTDSFSKKKHKREKETLVFIGEQTFPETCYYCGERHHPMPRYVRGHECTTICNVRFAFVDDEPTLVPTECHEKAVAEGWTQRLDLSPLR